jgi:arabinan endo-1,5-alpha-L-arabinosidase
VSPIISVQPQSSVYAVGATPADLSITASVSDGGSLTYQWYGTTANSATGGTAIHDAVNARYTPPTGTAGTTYYYVVVTNTKNGKTKTATSDAARIVVSSPDADPVPPEITCQPKNASYYIGETTVPLEVEISLNDDGVISYQWYSNTENAATGGTAIQDAVNARYMPPVVRPGTMYYYVVITNTKNSKTEMVTSAVAGIVVSASPLKVKYVVNEESNGFVNVAPSDGSIYTATVIGGSFGTVNGLKVFDTGGIDSGTDITAPWDSNTTWDHYTNVGYVDLGPRVGDLLCDLEDFSIETYVYVPSDYQIVSLGNYVWTFADSDNEPSNAVWFRYREGNYTIKKDGTDESVENGYNTISLGSWHQILVSKNNSTAAIYVDGSLLKTGTSATITAAFQAGTFTYNYLGKPAYNADEYLHNSRFYSFSLYDKAFSAAEVSALYAEGPMTDLRGGQTRPGAGFTFSDAATPSFSNVTVHDPSIFYTGSEYRVIGSFLASARTTDFIKWYSVQGDGNTSNYSSKKYYPKDNADSGIQTMAQQIEDVQRGEDSDTGWNFFASDIHKMPNGKFYHYYSITTSWKCSAIGVAIADTVEGNYVTQGLFVRSAEAGNNKAPNGMTTWSYDSHPNCIDPQAFFDKDGNFWLVYGSWSGGIFIYEIDPTTGKPKNNSTINNQNAGYGKRLIANRHSAIEAPYILYNPQSNYYYLFTSFGELGTNGGYNMRMFRSRNPDGPYEDAEHTDLASNNLHPTQDNTYDFRKYGVKIMGGYQFAHLEGEKGTKTTGYRAPGHNSACYEEATGKYYLIHHTRFVGGKNNIYEAHEVRVRELFLTEDNWLATSPFRYDAGTVRTFTATQLAGTWKIINHARDVNTTEHTSQTYRFLTNGTISNEGGTTAGTWELGSDGKTAHITIGGVLYKGVFLRCYDEDNTMWVQAFTALSDTGIALWGAGGAFN